ncbi:MAG: glycosyltransferase [Tissierellia bacterium]|nr:glycosyltransferase [Tissierellia bacterium]
MRVGYVIPVKESSVSGLVRASVKYAELLSTTFCNDICIFIFSPYIEQKITFNGFDILPISSFFHYTEGTEKLDLVHFHGGYIYDFYNMARICCKVNIPYIYSPQGELMYYAQHYKRLKKIVGNILYHNKFVKRAAAVHFLNENECLNGKHWCKSYFILPNIVEMSDRMIGVGRTFNSDKCPVFLFVGRMDIFHKGIDLLLLALYKVRANFSKNIKLFLVGPEHNSNDFRKIVEFIHRCDLHDCVSLLGLKSPEQITQIMNDVDYYIQTSRWEGQSLSILDALSAGLPCIVTKQTNMENLIRKYNAGWVCDLDAAEISNNILNALNVHNEYDVMSQNAKVLFRNEFNTKIIINNLMENYKRIIVNKNGRY